MTAKHPMIPFPVIVRAADGDIEAVNQIVRNVIKLRKTEIKDKF